MVSESIDGFAATGLVAMVAVTIWDRKIVVMVGDNGSRMAVLVGRLALGEERRNQMERGDVVGIIALGVGSMELVEIGAGIENEDIV